MYSKYYLKYTISTTTTRNVLLQCAQHRKAARMLSGKTRVDREM